VTGVEFPGAGRRQDAICGLLLVAGLARLGDIDAGGVPAVRAAELLGAQRGGGPGGEKQGAQGDEERNVAAHHGKVQNPITG
jgi:hypothetical protein